MPVLPLPLQFTLDRNSSWIFSKAECKQNGNIRLPLVHKALFSYSNLEHQRRPKWEMHPLYLDQDWHYALLNNLVSSKPFIVILNFAELNFSTSFQMGGPSYQRKQQDKEWSFSTQSLFHLCSKVPCILESLSFHTTR